VDGSCECANEPSRSMNYLELFGRFRNCDLLSTIELHRDGWVDRQTDE
jgi:hypothetical protein